MMKIHGSACIVNQKNFLEKIPGMILLEERNDSLMEEIQCYKEELKEEEKGEPDLRYIFLLNASGSMGNTQIKGLNGVAPFDVLKKFISNELNSLQKNHPQAKVGLIAFNQSLHIIGDGLSPIVSLRDKEAFMDKQKISTLVAEKASGAIQTPILKSCSAIKEKLNKIECNYVSALGPALVAGQELLKGGNAGSKLMLFTDGNSNAGVGNLDPGAPLDKDFYKMFARTAHSTGIEISVYTCAAEEINMEVYFQLVKETYGNFLIVSPEQIAKEFTSPDDKKEIARNAMLTVYLNPMFKFHNVFDPLDIERNENILCKKYGFLSENRKELLKIVVNKPKAPRFQIDSLRMVMFQCVLDFYKNKQKYKVVVTKRFPVMREKKEIDLKMAHMYAGDITQTRLMQGKGKEASEEIKALLDFAQNKKDPEKEQELKGIAEISNQLQPVHHKGDAVFRINKTGAMRGATTHFRPKTHNF
eukprot:TRINITY_DN14092_c0_g1_i4.p1 TRINITY_DN14092_c0_g1~~TRINITY_DN14092_c0_g1_i4.p1  ORF type:complete len:473 (-),score=94.01 TRINITY_DN14092_c0_g1_i4:46-1464(-)